MLSVGRVMEQSAVTHATAPKSSEQVSEKNTSTLAADSTDKYIKSGAGFTPAYTKPTVTDNRSGTTGESTNAQSNASAYTAQRGEKQEDADKTRKAAESTGASSMRNTKQAKNELMRDMVYSTINDQRANTNKSAVMSELDEILNSYGLADEAEKDPEFWSADKTAGRILDFAKNLAGDDNELLETLRGAFEQGFKEVEKYFGGSGKLPGVSYDTYDIVQKGFDDWKDEINAASEAVAAQN